MRNQPVKEVLHLTPGSLLLPSEAQDPPRPAGHHSPPHSGELWGILSLLWKDANLEPVSWQEEQLLPLLKGSGGSSGFPSGKTLYFFGCPWHMQKFPGQGANSCPISDP